MRRPAHKHASLALAALLLFAVAAAACTQASGGTSDRSPEEFE